MTTAMPNSASSEISDIDSSARCSLSFLIIVSLLWLVTGGVLALINLVQLHSPEFLADCPFLTHGRVQAMQETALIYGWATNAGLAVALWLLARMGGSPLRGTNFIVLGAIFWNIGVKMGIVGIAVGEMTSFSMLQMPPAVQPLMLIAFAVMAAPGVLAWTGRRADSTYATQWYAVAGLFLFPWLFSVAQVMLFFVPVRGVLQSVVSTWYVQNLFNLWLAPLAIAALYYMVPKIKGRVLPNYDFAIYGFWSLIFFGTWMGGRYLIGGPVPAWIPTLAFGASVMVLFHHIIVVLNLRDVFSPGNSIVLKFARWGFAAYLLGALIEVLFASRGLAQIVQFTFFQEAQAQLGLAAFSLVIFGALYFLAPRLKGAAWPSSALVRGHYLASILGFAILIVSLAAAGWQQGQMLNNAEIPFEAITSQTHSWLMVAAAAQALLLVGNIAFLIHFVRLLFVKTSEATHRQFHQPANLEASSS